MDDYIRKPKCKPCGGNLKPDNWQIKKNKEATCRCDGYKFPHRRECAPWCQHSKREPTEQEYQDRYG